MMGSFSKFRLFTKPRHDVRSALLDIIGGYPHHVVIGHPETVRERRINGINLGKSSAPLTINHSVLAV